jgi:hypothetical protein
MIGNRLLDAPQPPLNAHKSRLRVVQHEAVCRWTGLWFSAFSAFPSQR